MNHPWSWMTRRADGADLDRLLAVHVAGGARRPGAATARELGMWETMMTMPGLSVYLAEREAARAIGTLTMTLLPNITYDCCPSAQIEAVVVIPNERRRGVARSLLTAAFADARTVGVDKVQIMSHRAHRADGTSGLYLDAGLHPEADGFRRYLRSSPRRR